MGVGAHRSLMPPPEQHAHSTLPRPLLVRNFTADASSFVVTLPLDSSPGARGGALAWEAAFIRLAETRLTALAEGANLRVSYSSERWGWAYCSATGGVGGWLFPRGGALALMSAPLQLVA